MNKNNVYSFSIYLYSVFGHEPGPKVWPLIPSVVNEVMVIFAGLKIIIPKHSLFRKIRHISLMNFVHM